MGLQLLGDRTPSAGPRARPAPMGLMRRPTAISAAAPCHAPTTRPDLSTHAVAYNGLTVTSTNELGQQKIVKKDALGRNSKVTDDAGTAIVYTYDAIGELTQTRIAGVGATASNYAYDIRGNKI